MATTLVEIAGMSKIAPYPVASQFEDGTEKRRDSPPQTPQDAEYTQRRISNLRFQIKNLCASSALSASAAVKINSRDP
jgi:hypothetical protein